MNRAVLVLLVACLGFCVYFANACVSKGSHGASFACRADLNGNEVVDPSDLNEAINAQGKSCFLTGTACRLDFNDNGVVDRQDVKIVEQLALVVATCWK